MKRIIVGISGSSGVIYGIRLLQVLQSVPSVETHLVMSPAAKQTALLETDWTIEEIEALADVVHKFKDVAASISSGSFRTDGMVVIPCSVKTLAGIALSFSENLLLRAADVTLKERRPLVLVVRETPLHVGHLRLLVQAAELGAVILPPVPAFYHRPKRLTEIIDQTVNRVLDMLHIDLPKDLFERWRGAAVHRERAVDSSAKNLRECVLQYLRTHNVMTLATIGPEGPWAADVFYVNEGLSLYWLSHPETRHSQYLAADPRVAVTVHQEYDDWRAIQGVQMDGVAEAVAPFKERRELMDLYVAKYPFMKGEGKLHPELTRARDRAWIYRFTPRRVYWIDNRRGLGRRVEVPLSSP